LCEVVAQAGYSVRAALRAEQTPPAPAADTVKVGDIGATTDWSQALAGVDCIIHAAARAHVLHDDVAAAKLYFETNEHGTRALAQAAARAGIRRFVYISSIKVNGEETG